VCPGRQESLDVIWNKLFKTVSQITEDSSLANDIYGLISWGANKTQPTNQLSDISLLQMALGRRTGIKGLFLHKWTSVLPNGGVMTLIKATFRTVCECLQLRNDQQHQQKGRDNKSWTQSKHLHSLETIYQMAESADPGLRQIILNTPIEERQTMKPAALQGWIQLISVCFNSTCNISTRFPGLTIHRKYTKTSGRKRVRQDDTRRRNRHKTV
jgi:hypothetical protein